MNSETKAWVEAMKNFVKEYPGARDIHRFIEIIESQEKEIERLKESSNKIRFSTIPDPNSWDDSQESVFEFKTDEDAQKCAHLFNGMIKEIEKLNFIITTVLDPSRKLSKIEGLEAK